MGVVELKPSLTVEQNVQSSSTCDTQGESKGRNKRSDPFERTLRARLTKMGGCENGTLSMDVVEMPEVTQSSPSGAAEKEERATERRAVAKCHIHGRDLHPRAERFVSFTHGSEMPNERIVRI